MKKIFFIISTILFLSCNSDDNLLNPNEIINEINISKITVIGSSGFKEIFELNSKNQIITKTINNNANDIITYNFQYDNSGKLVKQTRVPNEIQGSEYFFNTEYDNNGLLKNHKSGTGFGYSISVDNSDINNPIIRRRGKVSTWGFNGFNEPLNDEWNEYIYSNNNLISESQEGYTNPQVVTPISKTIKTIEFNSIKNPISIMKQNTYGKRNLLFYFFEPTYTFRDKILDISKNIFSKSTEKFTDYENDGITILDENITTMNVEIIEQDQNYATHFLVKTNDYAIGEYTKEYIIELK